MIRAVTASAAATRALAAGVAALCEPGDLILLVGDIGAGKTTFTQGFAAGLGVDEAVTSPTFTLVRHYRGRLPLHHVDVYRLESLGEAVELGLAELLDSDAVTLVEWGDTVRAVLGGDYLEVRMAFGEDDEQRALVLRAVGRRWGERFDAVATAVAGWTDEGTPC